MLTHYFGSRLIAGRRNGREKKKKREGKKSQHTIRFENEKTTQFLKKFKDFLTGIFKRFPKAMPLKLFPKNFI